MRRRTAEKQFGSEKKGLDTSESIPTGFYCSEELRSIVSSEAALSRSFSFVNLSSPHKTNLHIRAYIDYYGGYAEHGRNVVLGLDRLGHYDIKLTPIKTPIDIDPIVWNKLNWFTKNPNFKYKNSMLMTIAGPGWMQKKFLSESRINIGWTMIESLEAHPDIIEWLGNCDYVLCPTEMDVRRFKKAKTELVQMRLGYDHHSYHPKVEPLDITNCRGKFVFGVLGSWNKRKNVKGIIHAFIDTFGPEDDVTLLLCCKYGIRPYGEEKDNEERWTIKYELDQYLIEIGKTIEECPHMVLLDIPVHETVMPHLMARFDCLVGFSMGESTWLPGLQAMAMGIPIIQLATESNGCMEYLPDVAFLCYDSKLIEADEELIEGTSEYYEGQLFAEGFITELTAKMKYIYENYEEIKVSDRIKQGLEKAKDWTWDKSIKRLDKFLRKI